MKTFVTKINLTFVFIFMIKFTRIQPKVKLIVVEKKSIQLTFKEWSDICLLLLGPSREEHLLLLFLPLIILLDKLMLGYSAIY